MTATAPGSDQQAVSRQDIQQILTEVRALNGRMDTLTLPWLHTTLSLNVLQCG